jgi:hypothetical protein
MLTKRPCPWRHGRSGGAHRRWAEVAAEEGGRLVGEVAGALVVLGEAPVGTGDGRSSPTPVSLHGRGGRLGPHQFSAEDGSSRGSSLERRRWRLVVSLVTWLSVALSILGEMTSISTHTKRKRKSRLTEAQGLYCAASCSMAWAEAGRSSSYASSLTVTTFGKR